MSYFIPFLLDFNHFENEFYEYVKSDCIFLLRGGELIPFF